MFRYIRKIIFMFTWAFWKSWGVWVVPWVGRNRWHDRPGRHRRLDGSGRNRRHYRSRVRRGRGNIHVVLKIINMKINKKKIFRFSKRRKWRKRRERRGRRERTGCFSAWPEYILQRLGTPTFRKLNRDNSRTADLIIRIAISLSNQKENCVKST